jgi:hypothetical protein
LSDPSYLQHLGELATLKRFLLTAYYQTVWDDFDSHEDIWIEYAQGAHQDELRRLVEQMSLLLARKSEYIFDFFSNDVQPDGLYFDTAQGAIEWLKRCQSYMQAAVGSL